MTLLKAQKSSNFQRNSQILLYIYELLLGAFGPQGWWPAESPFEVCVGAILTQNTNWLNVEKAIKNLKERDLLDPKSLYKLPFEELAELIRPCGYYNVKARRLKNFLTFLIKEYGGDLSKMAEEETQTLRNKLLAIKGLGPETVDSILLYAFERPVFVVDAYTYRILSRHRLVPEEIDYESLRSFFETQLPQEVPLFKEYHALIVACGKNFCKKSHPRCDSCPLRDISN